MIGGRRDARTQDTLYLTPHLFCPSVAFLAAWPLLRFLLRVPLPKNATEAPGEGQEGRQ